MAKNSIFDPTKDGVKADNSGYSSNQIDTLIEESAAAVIDDDAAGDDTVYSSAKIYSLLPEDTATGAEVTITDACPDLPIVELTAEINAVQEGTGDPSPDNVRPISGWDEITVTHDGIDVEISLGDDTVYGGTYNSDGTLTVKAALKTFDHTSNWSAESLSIGANFYVPMGSEFKKGQYGNSPYFKCNASKASETSNIQNANVCLISGSGNFNYAWGATLSCSTAEDFKTYLETNELTIEVYAELATPTTLTVGILTFNTNGEGSTIISCDSGDVTVKYKKLTTLS